MNKMKWWFYYILGAFGIGLILPDADIRIKTGAIMILAAVMLTIDISRVKKDE